MAHVNLRKEPPPMRPTITRTLTAAALTCAALTPAGTAHAAPAGFIGDSRHCQIPLTDGPVDVSAVPYPNGIYGVRYHIVITVGGPVVLVTDRLWASGTTERGYAGTVRHAASWDGYGENTYATASVAVVSLTNPADHGACVT